METNRAAPLRLSLDHCFSGCASGYRFICIASAKISITPTLLMRRDTFSADKLYYTHRSALGRAGFRRCGSLLRVWLDRAAIGGLSRCAQCYGHEGLARVRPLSCAELSRVAPKLLIRGAHARNCSLGCHGPYTGERWVDLLRSLERLSLFSLGSAVSNLIKLPFAMALTLLALSAMATGATSTFCKAGTNQNISKYCGEADPGQGYVALGDGCYQRNTGRNCTGIEESPPVFDAEQYEELNGDVAAAGIDPKLHWDRDGKAEGRIASLGFEVKEYLAANPDVAATFGPTNYVAALNHYSTNGLHERRPTRTTQVDEPNWTATIYNAPTVPPQPTDDSYFVQIPTRALRRPTTCLIRASTRPSSLACPNVKGMRFYGPEQTTIDG